MNTMLKSTSVVYGSLIGRKLLADIEKREKKTKALMIRESFLDLKNCSLKFMAQEKTIWIWASFFII